MRGQPPEKMSRIRQHFRAWRKHRALTQEQLAAAVGLSTAAISQIETGKQGFTDTTLGALAEALSCTPADLLMRSPADPDQAWSLWERVAAAPPAKRKQIVAVVETMLGTETDG